MILRRIAQHMKQQQWTGVLIELVIVILGVFIGLQASNWNSARHERAEGHRIIEQIYKDVQDSIALQAKITPTIKARFESTRDLAHMLRTGQAKELSDAQLQKRFENLGAWNGLAIIDTTLGEVNRSGRYDLIESESLRRKLVSFYNQIQGYEYRNQNLGKSELQNIHALQHELAFDWEGEKRIIVTPRSAILADKALESTVEYMSLIHYTIYETQLQMNRQTLKMRDVLAAYLHKKTKP